MCGAGDRDRTGMTCLEGRSSTIELHPRVLMNNRETVSLVGAAGFEPAAPCSQSRCATKLRYAP